MAEQSRFMPRKEVPEVGPGRSRASICACVVIASPLGSPGGSVSGICCDTAAHSPLSVGTGLGVCGRPAAYRPLSVGTWMGCCGHRSTEYIAIRIGNCRSTGQHPENGLTPAPL